MSTSATSVWPGICKNSGPWEEAGRDRAPQASRVVGAQGICSTVSHVGEFDNLGGKFPHRRQMVLSVAGEGALRTLPVWSPSSRRPVTSGKQEGRGRPAPGRAARSRPPGGGSGGTQRSSAFTFAV